MLTVEYNKALHFLLKIILTCDIPDHNMLFNLVRASGPSGAVAM